MIAGLIRTIDRPAIKRYRPQIALLTALVAVTAVGCSSDSSTAAGPSPVKCALTAALASATIDAAGGTSGFSISTTPECTWTATADAAWVSGFSPASGQGSGQVEFRVASNPQASARETDIVVNNERLRVRQGAAACSVDVAVGAQTVSGGGGVVPLTVSAPGGCAWTIAVEASWITATPASGSGNATVNLQIAANDGSPRSGTVRVGDQSITITQTAGGCGQIITPQGQNIGVGGGPGGPIVVQASPECGWSAVSTAPWITVTSGSSGSGNGAVTFEVAANTGSARTGGINIGSQTFVVNQAGTPNCSYTIGSSSYSVGSAGGVAPAVTVSTTAACSWSVSSSVPWITVLSGAAGTGGGSVTYQIAANTGGARTGTLTIAGHLFSVSQEGVAGCTYAFTPQSEAVGSAGGGRSLSVATTAGCSWSATSDVSWITITPPASGSGNGTVAYTVAANTGAERTGNITIGGQTFTVTQSGAPPPGPCTFTLNPQGQSLSAGGGNGSFAVNAGSACNWTAASNASWVTVTGGTSGTGNGTVSFTVAANTGSQRTGTITAGGQPFSVTQTASCSFSISSPSQTIGASGGNGSNVSVTTDNGCTWTAVSNAPWITVTGGQSGNGNGSVSFTVAANTGGQRSGTLTIAGQTHTVNQDSQNCNFSIAPQSQSIGASGGTGNSVNVKTNNNGCSWTAVSNVPWIKLTSGQTGSGDGSVGFTVDANISPARSGTLTIAGQTHTVDQASGCSIRVAPQSAQIGATGGTGFTFAVTAGPGCTWNASSTASWISLAPPTAGTGDGSVSYTVAANTGSARNGTITVGGQTFTVNQASGCSFTVTPPTQTSFTALGGTASVRVTASNSACTWQASSSSWINIPPSGTGTGDVNFVVTPNTTLANRNGTITVAGQTFNITQAAAIDDCNYAILPTSQTIDENGGDGVPVLVATEQQCAWTAASHDGWITIASGQSGTGPGTVRFFVRSFNGNRREGTMTIAEQTFTVTQVDR